MEALYVMIPISILLGSSFLALFILASKKGQFDDLETPAFRMLLNDKDKTEDKKNSVTENEGVGNE